MPTCRMMTARKAAPLLPENNDGFSYLYISQCDPTPESIHLVAPYAPTKTHKALAAFLHSLRRVKRLTHIAHELQAPHSAKNGSHQTLAGRALWGAGDSGSKSVTAPKDALLTCFAY